MEFFEIFSRVFHGNQTNEFLWTQVHILRAYCSSDTTEIRESVLIVGTNLIFFRSS